uniref:PABC domain-containing protein n=1 Tax=Arcella intermedia TaxID=1963864 RepID=A0A6B2LIS9_9EUKA
MIPTEHGGEVGPLTMDLFENCPEEEQKLIFGEYFYSIIQKTHPSYAGKITGMILEAMNISDLLGLLYDEHKFNEIVSEAVSLLKQVKDCPRTNNIGCVPINDRETLTLSVLSRYSAEEQKQRIGEILYFLIKKTHPTLAGKVTGMILELGMSTVSLLELMSNEPLLQKKVAEAIGVLKAYKKI